MLSYFNEILRTKLQPSMIYLTKARVERIALYCMRTLKYALLGMLSRQDMTGYELTKLFEGALSEFWPIKQSQIYPELRKLTEEKLISYRIEITGQVLEKKVYSITEAGQVDFIAWLTQSGDLPPTPKEEFRMKLFFSDQLPYDERMCLMEEKLRQHHARLEHLRQNEREFDPPPVSGSAAMSDYLVLLGAIMREEAACAWLQCCLDLCRET